MFEHICLSLLGDCFQISVELERSQWVGSKGLYRVRQPGSDAFSLLKSLDAAKFVMLSLSCSYRDDVPKM